MKEEVKPTTLYEKGDIDVCKIRSSDNPANQFTKALPTSVFKKHVHNIGMCQLKDFHNWCSLEGK